MGATRQLQVEPMVTGAFRTQNEAATAMEQLYGIGVRSDEITLMVQDTVSTPENRIDRASGPLGGAMVGAVVLGLPGLLYGWYAGMSSLSPPENGTLEGTAVLSSATLGALAGAALGALIGALLATGNNSPEAEPVPETEEAGVLLTVRPTAVDRVRAENVLRANGAQNVRTYGPVRLAEGSVAGREPLGSNQEVNLMTNNQGGVDQNSTTGTQDSIDPETGALGTAGTPVTTGYGVSGSTAGTGSTVGRERQESGDFVGETPDAVPYEMGGRSGDDAQDPPVGRSGEQTVEQEFGDATGREQLRRKQAGGARDIYEAGPSYGTDDLAPPAASSSARYLEPDEDAAIGGRQIPAERDTRLGSDDPRVIDRSDRGATYESGAGANVDDTMLYSDSSVESAPTYATTATDSSQASSGTDIPGTSDPRGLGDNTDTPEGEPKA